MIDCKKLATFVAVVALLALIALPLMGAAGHGVTGFTNVDVSDTLDVADLNVSGTATITGVLRAYREALTMYTPTSTWTLTAADTGKVFYCPGKAAQAIVLPANGTEAGWWARFLCIGDDNYVPTITAATADTMIGPNDVDLDSVTFGSGHRIGAAVEIVFVPSGSSTVPLAINVGSTTMTGND